MMYLMSYDLYHMSYLMSYIIWSHGFGLCLVFRTYDLMTRVDALYLPSTGHLLRILIPLEEPPHLTADLGLDLSIGSLVARLNDAWWANLRFAFGIWFECGLTVYLISGSWFQFMLVLWFWQFVCDIWQLVSGNWFLVLSWSISSLGSTWVHLYPLVSSRIHYGSFGYT